MIVLILSQENKSKFSSWQTILYLLEDSAHEVHALPELLVLAWWANKDWDNNIVL